MEKVQIKVILLMLLGSLFLVVPTMAQEDLSRYEREKIAKEAITDLKDGTLILRLKSKHNKITKLEELLAAPDIKESVRTRLRKELATTIDERNRYNLSLTNAFNEYYSFSKIYYMYDTASVSLKKGTKKGIFLNKNLELDPTISIPEGNFFVIRTGTTNSASTTGIDALVIMDNQLKDFTRPFPYYVRVNSISRLFTRIFNHKNLVKKDSKTIVIKLEKNLRRYAGELVQ